MYWERTQDWEADMNEPTYSGRKNTDLNSFGRED